VRRVSQSDTLKATSSVVALRGVSKRFGRVAALTDVTWTVAEGEVHALLGENGAGKSTALALTMGLTRPDTGHVEFRGAETHWRSSKQAIESGLGLVHQHHKIVPTLTALENVWLGAEPRRAGALNRLMGVVDWAEAERRTREVADRFGMEFTPHVLARDCSLGELQRLEILKILVRGAKVILLDEPTAVLTPREVDTFLDLLRRLRDDQHTIVLTSHKLHEIKAVGTRFTVLRDGRVVTTGDVADVSESDMVRAMIGRAINLEDRPTRSTITISEPMLVVDGISTRRASAVDSTLGLAVEGCPLDHASLVVRRGEVLGLAGVEGNGQAALEAALAGWIPITTGRISLDGNNLGTEHPGRRRALGLATLPGDRHRRGAILDLTVRENILLEADRPLGPPGWKQAWLGGPSRQDSKTLARELVIRFGVEPPDAEVPMRALSGGNQQKVVCARLLAGPLKAIVAAHPTRGVDVAAQRSIHDEFLQRREEGAAIIVISSDLPELFRLADTVQVILKGRLSPAVPVGATDPFRLGEWMTRGWGGSPPN